MSNQPPVNPEHRRQTEQGNRRPVRRKSKKIKNMIPVIVLGIIGVVIIALIIMGFKSLFSSGKDNDSTSSTVSSILDSVGSAITPTATPEPTATPGPTAAPEKDITGKDVEKLDSMVIVGDSGYEYYKFDNDNALKYIEAINKAGKSAEVPVTDIILPSSIDIMLPLSFLNDYAAETSDQKKATEYIYKQLDSSITTVPLYEQLKAHCNEDIYFRTDNHITGLGAYYVYEAWAGGKGITPIPLSNYTKTEYDGFLGNLYTSTENSAISDSETVEVYESKEPLTLKLKNDEGTLTEYPVYADVTEYGSGYKYSTFLTGSNSYAELYNSNVKDSSACVLVIDSNGTAIAPYIAQHFATTYVVDYRDYTESVASLAKDKGASEIIYCTSIVATKSDSLIEYLNNVNG